MVRVIAFIIVGFIVIGILGTIGFIGVKTGMYMINQKFNFTEAIEWSWTDYCNFITGFFNKANAEDGYWETEITVNKYIDVKACTDL